MDDARRDQIIRLLQTRDDHLPTPVRHVEVPTGFVNEQRPRTCPDCLANGRTMPGCETCGGSGVVSPARLERVAATDELPDDGAVVDPYVEKKVVPYGFDATRHDHAVERDRQIERLREQTRPAPTEAELLEEANRRGYAWEEERRAMYARFDYAALDQALDGLRHHDDGAYHAIHAVYVHAWMVELSPAYEAALERGLGFLGERLPDPLRSPGFEQKHPALVRRDRKLSRLNQQRQEDVAA